MKFENAKQIIKQKYTTEQKRTDVEGIVINKFLNFGNMYYIVLMDYNGDVVPEWNGHAVLTDYAETSHLLGNLISKTNFEEVCKKHNIDFRNGCIEKKFESIADVDNFVKVLDELSAKYEELEDWLYKISNIRTRKQLRVLFLCDRI